MKEKLTIEQSEITLATLNAIPQRAGNYPDMYRAGLAHGIRNARTLANPPLWAGYHPAYVKGYARVQGNGHHMDWTDEQ